jgi:hypothetical protein
LLALSISRTDITESAKIEIVVVDEAREDSIWGTSCTGAMGIPEDRVASSVYQRVTLFLANTSTRRIDMCDFIYRASCASCIKLTTYSIQTDAILLTRDAIIVSQFVALFANRISIIIKCTTARCIREGVFHSAFEIIWAVLRNDIAQGAVSPSPSPASSENVVYVRREATIANGDELSQKCQSWLAIITTDL